MADQGLGHPVARPNRDLWQMALHLLAVLVVVVSGVLLARVLMSPAWARAINVVGAGAVVLVLLASPPAGLLLSILLVPFARYLHLQFELGSGIPDLDIARLASMVLLTLLVAEVVAGKRQQLPRLTLTDVAMVACAGAILLSAPASHLGLVGGAQTVFDAVIIPFLAYYFARRWLNSKGALLALVATAALLGTLLGLITVREQLTGYAVFSPIPYSLAYEYQLRKVLSVFGSPPTMAITLAITLPLLIYGIQKVARPQHRLYLGLAMLIMLAGVFFAYVRAGWLGALVGVAVVIALSPSARRALLPLLPIVAIVVLLLIARAVVSPQTVQLRLASEAPISYRLTAWRYSWDIFLQSPLIGIGYDNFGQTAATEFGWNPHTLTLLSGLPSPHNSYLYVLVSGGLLALVPYLAVFVLVALRGLAYWRTLPGHRDAVAVLWATMLSYLVMNGTFDAVNAQFPNILLFAIAGAILGNLGRESATSSAGANRVVSGDARGGAIGVNLAGAPAAEDGGEVVSP